MDQAKSRSSRAWIAAIATVLFAIAAPAAATEPRPLCSGPIDLCGYVDSSGSEVIAWRFEKARSFKGGLAAVRIRGRWGFIQPSGEIAIEPRYDAVSDFQDDRAEVILHGRAGVIDRTGSYVLNPKYVRAIPFTENVSLVSETGPSASGDNLARDWLSGSFRLYHHDKGWLTAAPQEFQWFRDPKHGFSTLIWAKDTGDSKLFGLMNDRGVWIVEPSFSLVQRLAGGRAVVSGPKPSSWGALDEDGRVVVPLTNPWLSYFENGYALLGDSGEYPTRKLGLIRSNGVVLLEPKFDGVRMVGESGDPEVKSGGVWYRVAADGGLSPAEADGRLVASCPQGLKIKIRGAGFVIEDEQGQSAFDEPVRFIAVSDGRSPISRDNLLTAKLDCGAPISISLGETRSTYVSPQGRPLFNPPLFFSRTDRFYRGHAVVGNEGKDRPGEWAIIDAEGQFTLPLGPKPISSQRAFASATGEVAVFSVGDKENARLTDARGKPLPDVEEARKRTKRESHLKCPGGNRISGDENGFGIVSVKGDVLVPAKYRAVYCFQHGLAWAPDDRRRMWCPIGPDGSFRDRPQCQTSFYYPQMFDISPESLSNDPYESSVLWARAKYLYGLGFRDELPGYTGRFGRF